MCNETLDFGLGDLDNLMNSFGPSKYTTVHNGLEILALVDCFSRFTNLPVKIQLG